MTTQVTVFSHPAKSSNNLDLECVVIIKSDTYGDREVVVPKGETQSFSAFEGTSVTIVEREVKTEST